MVAFSPSASQGITLVHFFQLNLNTFFGMS